MPKSSNAVEIFTKPCTGGFGDIWRVFGVFILITGVGANTTLLWLFLRERKSLSASQVLGVNLVAMDLIYLSFIPFSMDFDTHQPINDSAISPHVAYTLHSSYRVGTIFSVFHLIGCPLLLACMCVERYVAVARPLLYLRMRKREYRMAVSAVVWGVTLSFCLVVGLSNNLQVVVMPAGLFISGLFVVMLACLGGVVVSLLQSSPGNHTGSEAPLKRRAVVNVLVVVVPAVVSYLPIMLMFPVIMGIMVGNFPFSLDLCMLSELSVLFPNFGVLIGPLFYLSKARQMCRVSR